MSLDFIEKFAFTSFWNFFVFFLFLFFAVFSLVCVCLYLSVFLIPLLFQFAIYMRLHYFISDVLPPFVLYLCVGVYVWFTVKLFDRIQQHKTQANFDKFHRAHFCFCLFCSFFCNNLLLMLLLLSIFISVEHRTKLAVDKFDVIEWLY